MNQLQIRLSFTYSRLRAIAHIGFRQGAMAPKKPLHMHSNEPCVSHDLSYLIVPMTPKDIVFHLSFRFRVTLKPGLNQRESGSACANLA